MFPNFLDDRNTFSLVYLESKVWLGANFATHLKLSKTALENVAHSRDVTVLEQRLCLKCLDKVPAVINWAGQIQNKQTQNGLCTPIFSQIFAVFGSFFPSLLFLPFSPLLKSVFLKPFRLFFFFFNVVIFSASLFPVTLQLAFFLPFFFCETRLFRLESRMFSEETPPLNFLKIIFSRWCGRGNLLSLLPSFPPSCLSSPPPPSPLPGWIPVFPASPPFRSSSVWTWCCLPQMTHRAAMWRKEKEARGEGSRFCSAQRSLSPRPLGSIPMKKKEKKMCCSLNS